MSTPEIDQALEQVRDRRELLAREESIHAEATRVHAAAKATLDEAERAYAAILATDAPDAKVGAAFTKMQGAKGRLEQAVARVQESARLIAARRVEVAHAETLHERATLEQEARDAESAPEVVELGATIVDLVLGLRAAVGRIEQHIAAGAVRVKRLRELGATVPQADGTALAAALARALYEHGGGLPGDWNPHRLRHAFEPATLAHAPSEPAAHDLAKRLLAISLESLHVGARPDAAMWREGLARVAEAWRGKANRVDAERELRAAEQSRADADAAEVAKAHERRLIAAKDREKVATARHRQGAVEWIDRAADRVLGKRDVATTTAPPSPAPVHPAIVAREAELRAQLGGEAYLVEDFKIPEGVG